MEQLGIDPKCPACGYILRGLPATYRCPECAFEYEADMLVLRPSGKWRVFLAIFVPIFLLFTAVGIAGKAIRGSFNVPGLDLYLIMFFGIPTLRYILDLRKPQFLVMRKNDIHWQKRGKRTETIPWSKITGIKPNRFTEVVELERRDGSKTEIPREFWPKSISIGDFADLVQKRWQNAAVQFSNDTLQAMQERLTARVDNS
jgi:hypothetical protein